MPRTHRHLNVAATVRVKTNWPSLGNFQTQRFFVNRGISSSSSSYICHGVGPLVDPFRSHVSRSLFKVCHDSFCQLRNSVSLPWVIYYGAFYLHVVSSFSYIPVICPKLVLFLIPLQFVYLFCNLSEYNLLFFSCISSQNK